MEEECFVIEEFPLITNENGFTFLKNNKGNYRKLAYRLAALLTGNRVQFGEPITSYGKKWSDLKVREEEKGWFALYIKSYNQNLNNFHKIFRFLILNIISK